MPRLTEILGKYKIGLSCAKLRMTMAVCSHCLQVQGRSNMGNKGILSPPSKASENWISLKCEVVVNDNVLCVKFCQVTSNLERKTMTGVRIIFTHCREYSVGN